MKTYKQKNKELQERIDFLTRCNAQNFAIGCLRLNEIVGLQNVIVKISRVTEDNSPRDGWSYLEIVKGLAQEAIGNFGIVVDEKN